MDLSDHGLLHPFWGPRMVRMVWQVRYTMVKCLSTFDWTRIPKGGVSPQIKIRSTEAGNMKWMDQNVVGPHLKNCLQAYTDMNFFPCFGAGNSLLKLPKHCRYTLDTCTHAHACVHTHTQIWKLHWINIPLLPGKLSWMKISFTVTTDLF
jgi:hypothetical protein